MNEREGAMPNEEDFCRACADGGDPNGCNRAGLGGGNCEQYEMFMTLQDEIARLTAALADMTAKYDELLSVYEGQVSAHGVLSERLADMTAERDAAQQLARYERGTKEAFYIKYLVENKKTFKLDVHLQKARGQRDALKAERDNLQSENDALVRARQFYEVERDAAQRRAEAAEKDIKDAISMSPYAICGLFCKNHKPGCGGKNCRPEWRGPDAQRDT